MVNPIMVIASSEEESGNGSRRGKVEDEHKIISDLTDYPNLRGMVEAEAFMRRNKRRGNEEEEDEGGGGGNKSTAVKSKVDEYRQISDLNGFDNLRAMMEAEALIGGRNNSNVDFPFQETDAAKEKENPIVLITSSEEEADVRKGTRRVRSKLDEYEKISDLSGFPNLKSMIEAESFLRRKNYRNIEASQLSNDLKIDPIIMLTTSCEEEEEENESKEKRKECEGTKRSKLDQHREISDLIGFDNLKAMIEAEASMRRKKRRSKKKRSKKSRNVVFCVQEEVTEHATKEKGQLGKDEAVDIVEVSNAESVQISKIDVLQNLVIDSAKEEEDAGTLKAVETTMVIGAGDVVNPVEVINSCLLFPKYDATISTVTLRRGVEDTLLKMTVANGMRKKRRRKKMKLITGNDMVDDDAKQDNGIKDNVVLQMLLRKPRYFDPPNCDWGSYSNCGKENYTAANCKIRKQDKRCFLCGSFEHLWKFCKQGNNCFVHKGRNDLGNNLSSNICLRCGYPGHDMFSCRVDYPADDLKAIQCYVCKKFGHLCCVNFPNTGRKQVSCYNCGQSGHMGSECIESCSGPWDTKSSILCSKCGTEGHYAQRCTTSLVWHRPGYYHQMLKKLK